MATAYSTLLGLALPVQGELSGTWGDMVDNGITRYVDIAVAGTVTLTNDGAVSLSLTNGDSSATNIVSSLTGAGTVSAQFAIIKVTGTLTTAKILTPPSSSRTYVVVNAATGSTVTVKAATQPGVSIAVGETAFVYFNGTDYVKVSGTAAGAAGGSTTQVQYNSSGVLAGSANMTFDGTTLTAAGFSGPHNGTVGATTANTGNFTTLTTSSTVTFNGGTANGVAYLNGSKVVTSGSALTFDGSTLTGTSVNVRLSNDYKVGFGDGTSWYSGNGSTGYLTFGTNNTERARFDVSGNLGIGTSSPNTTLHVQGAATTDGSISFNNQLNSTAAYSASPSSGSMVALKYNSGGSYAGMGGWSINKENATDGNYSSYFAIHTRFNGAAIVEKARVDSVGFFSGVWADKVSALGNSGTATTISCLSGNVFTATLTGNCTFTLSNPSTTTANTATSFTLILTNDATAGRTVAFAGGTFKAPGGSVTRTTTANATDIWFFFSPNGGTTWYYSIPMANLS